MANSEGKAPLNMRQIWIAVTIGVVAALIALMFLDWGLIPAIIGGFSIGVIWWSINRAFSGAS